MTLLLDLLRATLPSDYSIDGELKAGGEGSVFRGKYKNQPAAIKVFKPQSDPRRREREINCLQKIDCPTLVRVLAAENVMLQGIDHTVVAYEFHSGGDLTGMLSLSSPIDSDTLLNLAEDICQAIDMLWSHRIVHRDIKPANIVRTQNGGFVLVDVGLARHIDRSNITAPGLAPGTSGYMSPEQAMGRRALTIKSDIFSLGITLYEIAASEHPFRWQQHLIGVTSPSPLQSRRNDLPPLLVKLIHDMMNTRPAQRPTNLSERIENIRSA
tara:strand:- start:2328 stop:3134 length:807 start_codon:yes stop_codon:yes gene_type:complete